MASSDRERPYSSEGSSSTEGAPEINKQVVDNEKAQLGQIPVPILQGTAPVVPKTTLGLKKSKKSKKEKSEKASIEEEKEDPLAYLPEHERNIIRRQLEIPPVKVTYATLFRYATRNDMYIIAAASLGAAIQP